MAVTPRTGVLGLIASGSSLRKIGGAPDDHGDWRRVIDIDLTAVIDGTRLAVRVMRRSGHRGVVVNLCRRAHQRRQP